MAAVVVFVTSAVLTPAVRGEFAALQTGAILVAAAGGISLGLGVSVAVGAREDAARHGAAIALAGGLVLAAVLTPVALAVADPIGIGESAAIAVALAGAAVAAYGGLQGIPIGLGRLARYGAIDVTRAITGLLAITVGLAAGLRAPGSLVAVWAAGPVVAALALLRLVTRPQPGRPLGETARLIVRRALRAHPANLAGLAVARLDVVVLAAVSTKPQVAYYTLALVIAEAAWLMPSALAVTSLSDFVRLPNDRAWQAARHALARTLGVAAISGVLAAAGGVAATLLFLSDAYHAALAPLAIALAGAIPYSVGHVVSPFLVTAQDRPGTATAIALATLVVDLALVVTLGGPLGAIGAAIASTVAYALHAALNLVALRRAAPG